MEWFYGLHSFWCRLQLSIISCSSGKDNQSITAVSQWILLRFVVAVQVAQVTSLFFFIKYSLSRLENFLGIACAGNSWEL